MNSENNFLKKSKDLLKSEYILEETNDLTCPNRAHNYQTIFKSNNYLVKSKKMFKHEKYKVKEDIFKTIKEMPRKQIKRDLYILNKNTKLLLESFSVLNNATIDEGIVLNKYFAYLKRADIEYKEMMKQKYKNMIIPIELKEKEIKNLIKKIRFHKSVSNQMMMKYMVDNKKKFKDYLKEVSLDRSERHRNTEPNNDSSKTRNFFSGVNVNSKYDKNNILTHSANFISRQILGKNKKVEPKLKLNIDIDDNKNDVPFYKNDTPHYMNDYNNYNNNTFITGYAKTTKTFQKRRPLSSNIGRPHSSTVYKKYQTPEMVERNSRLYKLSSATKRKNKSTNSKSSFSSKNMSTNISSRTRKIILK